MIAALEQHVSQGSLDKAMKFADLSVEPYPGLDRTHAYKGLLLLVSGEREKGKQALALYRTQPQRPRKPGQPEQFCP